MNICIFAKSTLAHYIGGMETHTENIAKFLSKAGNNVSVITTAHPNGVEFEEHNTCKYYYISGAPSHIYSNRWWHLSREKFIEINRTSHFDCIISMSLSAYSLTKLSGAPPIFMYIYGLMIDNILNQWQQISRFLDYPRFALLTIPESIYYSIIEKRMFQSVKCVLTTADTLLERVKNLANSVCISYNGIDTEICKPDYGLRNKIRKKLNIDEESIVFCMAGVIEKQKGFHIGIQAFSKIIKANILNKSHLLIIGQGSALNDLKSLVSYLGIDNKVIFTGAVKNQKLYEFLNCCDIFMHPSLRIEGLPTVVIEAMGCGIPVIATDTGGTKTAFGNDECGFLISRYDEQKLLEFMIKLAKDSNLRKKMGEIARERTKRLFDYTKIIQDLCQVISK